MTWVSNPDVILPANSWLSSNYAGNGILGADVPTTGEGGRPALAANDVAASGWGANQIRMRLQSASRPGLVLYEDTSYEWPGLVDGQHTATFQTWVDGVLQAGTSTLTVNVGDSIITATVAVREETDDIVAGTVTIATAPGGTVDVSIAMTDVGDDVPGGTVQVVGSGSQIPGPDPYPIIVWSDNALGGSSVERRYKQVAEVLDFDFDFGRWFSRRTDEPATAEVVVSSGLTLVNYYLLGSRIKVLVSGGTNRKRYKVTARMTTTSGIVEEADAVVVVKEQ